MENDPSGFDNVHPSIPDIELPSELVATSTSKRHTANRDRRFLKGPILLSWVRECIRDPADRLLLVLCAHADMRQSSNIKMTADIERDAGIANRKALYRALVALEAKGVLDVTRCPGSRSVVRLKIRPANISKQSLS